MFPALSNNAQQKALDTVLLIVCYNARLSVTYVTS